jgi:outer membrane lipopolysaccharide assembly protein LptE/RlpB
MKKALRPWAAAGLLIVVAGCYTFTGGSLPYRTIGVPVPANGSGEYRATDALTKALIAKLVKDGRLKVVEPKDAESTLAVDITGYSRAPYIYNKQEVVAQYKTTIAAKATLLSRAGKAAWHSDSLSAWSAYAADSAEATGIEKAADNLAAEIIRQAFESW